MFGSSLSCHGEEEINTRIGLYVGSACTYRNAGSSTSYTQSPVYETPMSTWLATRLQKMYVQDRAECNAGRGAFGHTMGV